MKAKQLAGTGFAALLLLVVSADIGARDVTRSSGSTDQASLAEAATLESFVYEDLGSGNAVDLYRVTCTAECIRADVNDLGPYYDAQFRVSINASSSAFVGNASTISPTGGTSLPAEVCSGKNADLARRAFVEVTQVNAAGYETYDTEILCRKADGTLINPTIVKMLDQ